MALPANVPLILFTDEMGWLSVCDFEHTKKATFSQCVSHLSLQAKHCLTKLTTPCVAKGQCPCEGAWMWAHYWRRQARKRAEYCFESTVSEKRTH